MTAKKARQHKGVTLQTVSDGSGLSKSMISKVENGKSTLTKDVRERLEAYYGCPIEASTDAYEVLQNRYNELLERYNKLLLKNFELETIIESIRIVTGGITE